MRRACVQMAGSFELEQFDSATEGKEQAALSNSQECVWNHPRTLTLINAFSEGINLCSADVGVNTELQASNGFELVRQLTLE